MLAKANVAQPLAHLCESGFGCRQQQSARAISSGNIATSTLEIGPRTSVLGNIIIITNMSITLANIITQTNMYHNMSTTLDKVIAQTKTIPHANTA